MATPRTRLRVNAPPLYSDMVFRSKSTDPFALVQADMLQYADYQSMTDTVTPDFKKRIQEGEVINNPCLLTVTRTRQSTLTPRMIVTAPGSTTVLDWKDGSLSERVALGNGILYLLPAEADIHADAAKAKIRAIANIDKTPYAFGEDIAELSQTLRFLQNPFKGMYRHSRRFLRELKDTQRKRPDWTLAEIISQLWLSYRFAFSPLLRSTLDAIEIYNGKRPGERPVRQTARGFEVERGAFNDTYQHSLSSDPEHFNVFKRGWDWEDQVHATILYEISNPMKDWKFHLGVRAKDIPITFWNVLPYSFMVDRVLDISTAVKAVVNLADPSIKILAGSERRKDRRNRNIQWDLHSTPSYNNGVNTTRNSDVKYYETFVYDRQPWAPSFSDAVNPPTNWGGLLKSIFYTVDLLTLIVSNLKGKRG